MKKYDEVWALDSERVRLFFEDHNEDENVIVTALPERKLGSISIPQTRIIIAGENADDLYHRFLLQFISAGG